MELLFHILALLALCVIANAEPMNVEVQDNVYIRARSAQVDSLHHNISSVLDVVLSRGYLKVGTTGDYRPFSYLSNGTSPSNISFIGADIDQAQSLSNALSLPKPVQFVKTSFANISQDMDDDRFDIAMSGISITTARAQKYFLSIPYQRVGQAACVRCTELSKYASGLPAIDQTGVKVGVNAGGENERFDRANLKKATLVVVQQNTQLYGTLLDGRADVVISDMVEVTLEAKLSNGTLCVANPGKPFDFKEKGYQMKKDIVWKEFVDTWLRIQVEGGAWNQTLSKWLDYEWGSV